MGGGDGDHFADGRGALLVWRARPVAYAVIGVAVWFSLLQAGVLPTLAGVALGLVVGKPLGVVLAVVMSVRAGVADVAAGSLPVQVLADPSQQASAKLAIAARGDHFGRSVADDSCGGDGVAVSAPIASTAT